MTGRAQYSPEEWNLVRKAPGMVGLAVVAASPSGPLGILKEMFAVGKLVGETMLQDRSNTLISSVVADLATREGREQAQPTEISGMSPEQAKRHALDTCRQVAALVDQKATREEAEGFKRWLLLLGRCAAEAAKEGGFLGIGGTRVSGQEIAALNEAAAALGVPAQGRDEEQGPSPISSP